MSWSDIPPWLRAIILARDGGQCQSCRMQQAGQGSAFHIDHVWPKSRGGPTRADNLAFQCPHCSIHKSTKVVGTDPETGLAIALFHPLRQRWADHFDLHPDGRCVGRDSVGRATVDALSMNAERPCEARKDQIRFGRLAPTISPLPAED